MLNKVSNAVWLIGAVLMVAGCGGFRAYDEPSDEPRSLMHVTNYSGSTLEVFVYDSNSCDEQESLGRLASVAPRQENKPMTPRAVPAGQSISFCIDVYDYEEDRFICRKGLGFVANASQNYRIEYRSTDQSCGSLAIKTLTPS